jgi:hypothetical protein
MSPVVEMAGRRFGLRQVSRLSHTLRFEAGWAELSAIALRLETCCRLTGDDVQELLAPSRRAA